MPPTIARAGARTFREGNPDARIAKYQEIVEREIAAQSARRKKAEADLKEQEALRERLENEALRRLRGMR